MVIIHYYYIIHDKKYSYVISLPLYYILFYSFFYNTYFFNLIQPNAFESYKTYFTSLYFFIYYTKLIRS